MFILSRKVGDKVFVKNKEGIEYELLPFELSKPNIESTKLLDKAEQALVRKALRADEFEIDDDKKTVKEKRNLIHAKLMPTKNDYENDYDRGTMEYTSECKNYSNHKVVIPDGTTIGGVNFTQAVPHSHSITGKNLHFIECNLNNIEIDPTWTTECCLTIHSKKVIVSEDSDKKEITYEHHVIKKGSVDWERVFTKTEKMSDKDYQGFLLKQEVQDGT